MKNAILKILKKHNITSCVHEKGTAKRVSKEELAEIITRGLEDKKEKE